MVETILLASSSLRRREILKDFGIPFLGIDPNIDENAHDGAPPTCRVLEIAKDKARAASIRTEASPFRLILAADTLVCIPAGMNEEERVLGKPENREEAKKMICLLSGRQHFVYTGLALLDKTKGILRVARSDSRVLFSEISEKECEEYLNTDEWKGAAGSYKIQGFAACYIQEIIGSWSGIVGLPIRELYGILKQSGYDFRYFSKA